MVRQYPNTRFAALDEETTRYLALNIEYGRRISGEVVFAGIGTPEVCADSFGPLLADRLLQDDEISFAVYGGTASPIDNLNFAEVIESISRRSPDCHIIVFDAAKGSEDELGQIIFNPYLHAIQATYGDNRGTGNIRGLVKAKCWPEHDATGNKVSKRAMLELVTRAHTIVRDAVRLANSEEMRALGVETLFRTFVDLSLRRNSESIERLFTT